MGWREILGLREGRLDVGPPPMFIDNARDMRFGGGSRA